MDFYQRLSFLVEQLFCVICSMGVVTISSVHTAVVAVEPQVTTCDDLCAIVIY